MADLPTRIASNSYFYTENIQKVISQGNLKSVLMFKIKGF